MQLAESKLNQALQVEFGSATEGSFPSTGLMTTSTVNWPAGNPVVSLGKETTLVNNTQFFSQLVVEMIPTVTFRYRQLKIDLNTNMSNPETWVWEGSPGDSASLKTIVATRKLKKLTIRVDWNEKRGQGTQTIDKSYYLHTLKAKLNE
jgi:hypothetical protein